jgi:hypothetical protein
LNPVLDARSKFIFTLRLNMPSIPWNLRVPLRGLDASVTAKLEIFYALNQNCYTVVS